MNHLSTSKRKTAAAAALIILAGLLLAACGGSSGGSTTPSTAGASASANAAATTPGAPPGQGAGRFSAFRECLAKNGITLPKFTPGQHPSGGGGFLGGGGFKRALPKGVSAAQYEAAVKKCGGAPGGGRFRGRFKGGFKGFASSPAAKEALDKFAACMRENGVNLPTPNTSGSGPIFNTSGVNVATAKFRAAESKCSADLRNAFHAGAGAGTASG